MKRMRRAELYKFPLDLIKSFQRVWLDSELISSTSLLSPLDVYGTSSCQCTCLVGNHTEWLSADTCGIPIWNTFVLKVIELIILMASKTVITACILETVKYSIFFPPSELALSRLPRGACSSAQQVKKYHGVVGLIPASKRTCVLMPPALLVS